MNAGYTLKAKRVYVPNDVILCIVKNFLQKDQKKLIVSNCYIIPVIVSTLEQTRPGARELADWKESMSAGLPSSRPTTSFKILEWIQQFLEWVKKMSAGLPSSEPTTSFKI